MRNQSKMLASLISHGDVGVDVLRHPSISRLHYIDIITCFHYHPYCGFSNLPPFIDKSKTAASPYLKMFTQKQANVSTQNAPPKFLSEDTG